MGLRLRPWQLLCLAVASLLVAASLVSGSPIASAENDASGDTSGEQLNPPPNDRSAPKQSERWYDDANELPGMDSPSRTQAEGRRRFRERFGGVWIDRSASPSRLVFGIVHPTESDRASVRQQTNNNARTDVVDVRYGADQLEKWRSEIEPVVKQSAERTNALFTLGVDPRAGSIYVEEDPLDPQLRSEIEALGVPEDAYRLQTGGGTHPAHATRDTFPPYEGGLNPVIRRPDGTSAESCTSWFTGKRTDGTPRGVTAGHCNANGATIPTDERVYIGNDDLGAPGGNTYVDNTDSDAVRIAITSLQLTNRINTGANIHRTVQAPRYQREDLIIGLHLCFNAVASGGVCGDIVQREFSANDTDTGITHDHLFEMDGDTNPGDSGGPVYGVRSNGTARPAGLVMGFAGFTPPANMRFHGAGYVLSDLGMCIYYLTSPCTS
jgi:hypothetical protein